MPEIRVKCPSCETVLKLSAPVVSGKAIKCPNCGAAVRVPVAAGKPSGPGAVGARSALRPQLVRTAKPEEVPDEEIDDLEDEEETPQPKKAARRAVDDQDDDFDNR